MSEVGMRKTTFAGLGQLATMLALVLVGVSIAGSASAQTMDSVELANGGLLRGTVIEHIPGDHVLIQLVTGELRTVPAAEVSRVVVGAAPVAPPPAEPAAPREPAPPPEPASDTVHVRFESDLPEYFLHRVTATATIRGSSISADSFEPVCRAPCDTELAPGSYAFGLSEREGPPRRRPGMFTLTRDTLLRVEHESRAMFRLAGFLTIGGTVLTAGLFLVAGRLSNNGTLDPSDGGGMDLNWGIGAMVVGVLGLAVGIPMAALFDRTELVLDQDGLHF